VRSIAGSARSAGAADQPELERTERMRAEVDAVIAALRGDGVDPADFG